jgi:hypothetical protein
MCHGLLRLIDIDPANYGWSLLNFGAPPKYRCQSNRYFGGAQVSIFTMEKIGFKNNEIFLWGIWHRVCFVEGDSIHND